MSAMDRGGRRTVESCVPFDVRDIPKHRRIGPPLPATEETVSFSYAGRLYTVTITWTRCGKGWRMWARCPACAARRAVLYFHRGQLSCRVCLNLQYHSQAATRAERVRLKFVKWRERQGLSGALNASYRLRRKGEHWAHYIRQRVQDAHLQNAATLAWIEGTSRLLRR